MNQAEKLAFINKLANPQRRLAALAKNGFHQEATQLIWQLAYTNTTFFWSDSQYTNLCQPLPEPKRSNDTVYVVIRGNGKEDCSANPGDDVVFELGWPATHLGWTREQVLQLVNHIFAQALTRPISHWRFQQAEGTAHAARIFLETTNRNVGAMQLVFYLRQAQFGHTQPLEKMENFPAEAVFKGDTDRLVLWIQERLHRRYDWSLPQINSELLGWMWTKIDTWPQWFLSVAKVITVSSHPQRTIAIRRYLQHKFGNMLQTVGVEREERTAYKELFRLANISAEDLGWVHQRLVKHMVESNAKVALNFMRGWGLDIIPLMNLDHVCKMALDMAKAAHQYGRAAKIMYHQLEGKTDDFGYLSLKERAEILGQPIE